MLWLEWIIKIGGAATAIALLWKGISRFVHLLDELKKDIKDLKEHSTENYLGIKRLTVMSPYMPLGERIIAGHDYIKNGGNGEVKHYCEDELHINDIQD